MLRFLGVRDYEVYQLTSGEIKQILSASRSASGDAASTSDETEEPICTICVGTVQFAEGFVEEIVARINKEDYITKTFNMNVTMPTSTLVRNHAVRIVWRNNFMTNPEDLVDIKEIFKLLISWPIEVQTGLTLDFTVRITNLEQFM